MSLARAIARSSIGRAILQIVACAATGPVGCAAAGAALTLAAGGTIKQAIIGAALAFVQVPGGMGAGGLWGAVGDIVASLPAQMQFIGSVVTHAVVGGAISMAQGGSFVSGALSGAVGAVGSGVSGELGVDPFSRIAISAVSGGTASMLSGGKFANGAITSAFATMYNDMAHGDGEDGAAGVRSRAGTQGGWDGKAWDAEISGRAVASSFLEDAALLGAGAISWARGAFAAGELTATGGIEVGGGASLRNLTDGQIRRIQNAADRYDRPITVVGSRAEGTADSMSDWDYIYPGPRVAKVLKSLPSGNPELTHPEAPSQLIRQILDKSRPYITFSPRGKP